MLRKNWSFIIMSLIVVVLFVLLYSIGFINYFFEDSDFFIKMKFLDFGSRLIAFFYLIVVSIFFVVIMAIMIKIVISPIEINSARSIRSELKNNQTATQISPELISTVADIAVKKIFSEHERRVYTIVSDGIFQERIDDVYYGITQMFDDISEASSALELFEKVLYWGCLFSSSRRGSVMIADREELTIYKTAGWKTEEKRIIESTKVKFNERVAGRVATLKEFVSPETAFKIKDYEYPDRNKYVTHEFISFPILSSDRVVAIFNYTNNKRTSSYSIGEVEILKSLQTYATRIYELLVLRKRTAR